MTAASPPRPVPDVEPSTNGQGELLSVEHLRMWFPVRQGILQRRVGWVRAVDDVSFGVRRGETLGLVGESGCGKTTVGRTVLQLYKPTAGSVRFEGMELTKASASELRRKRRDMQIVFQDPYASLNSRLTVGSIVAEPLEIHGIGLWPRPARPGLGAAAPGRPRSHRWPAASRTSSPAASGSASGSRARSHSSPSFIVCDEPISALDVSIQAQVVNLLQELQERLGLTYLFIAHDLSVVRHLSDRIAVMYLGKIVEITTRAALYERPLHPYTIALLSAVPIPDPVVERRRRRMILVGRRALAGEPALGVPVPHPLPVRAGAVPPGGAAARRGRVRPRRGLPLLGRDPGRRRARASCR